MCFTIRAASFAGFPTGRLLNRRSESLGARRLPFCALPTQTELEELCEHRPRAAPTLRLRRTAQDAPSERSTDVRELPHCPQPSQKTGDPELLLLPMFRSLPQATVKFQCGVFLRLPARILYPFKIRGETF